MQFSIALLAPLLAGAAYAADNSTVTATTFEETTTIVTITSCDEHTCETAVVPTGVTVVTITSENTVTEFTTFCPLTGTTVEPSFKPAVPETVPPAAPSANISNITTPEIIVGGASKASGGFVLALAAAAAIMIL